MSDGKGRNDRYKDVFSKEEVLKVLEKSLGTSDFVLDDYMIKAASDSPMGFLGDHMRIITHLTVNGKKKERIYFVKKIPTEVPSHLEYALKTRAFYKEIELYKTLFEDLKNAEKDPKNGIKWHPEYYYSRESEIFVIEDLSVYGYYMYPERTLLDEDHVLASLKAMAAMHAGSFIFEEKFNRGEVETLSPTFKKSGQKNVEIGEIYSHLTYETEASDIIGHPGNTFFNAGIKSQNIIVDLLPGYTAEEREKIKKILPDKLWRTPKEWVKPSNKYKNVFIHGDLWANNLLFRKDETGKVKDAVIIDFQLARYGPPAHDIIMFLHLVQNREFREKKQQKLLKYYYQELSEELAKNDLSVEAVLPWDVLIDSCNHYEEYGVANSVIYFQLILAPSEIVSKFLASPELFTEHMLVDRSAMIKECYLQDEVTRTRVTDAMNDLIKRYILT